MKVAIVSDIHANWPALKAVMEDIKEQGVKKILCLGDLAMAGPQPRMVIDFIRNQSDWIVIQGNTDKLIADFSPEIMEDMKSKFPVMAHALADDVYFLEDDKIEYLRNLPIQKKLEISGVKVLMVHGSPRKNNENIFPDMPLDKIEEIVKDADADLILCGHTHIPCGYQTQSKKTIVNVGSVGRPMTQEPKACYAIIDFRDGSFSVEHRFVDYDRETAAAIMKARGFDGCEILAGMILQPKPEKRHA